MQVNVQKFLEDAGVTEPFYPGKKMVIPCKQTGEYKSHCIVLDWRSPEKIRLEIRAGLSGKVLEPAKLKKHPVSFQTPTYVEIEIINDNDTTEDEDDEGKSASGKGGSGGKKPKTSLSLMTSAFDDVVDGKVPGLGKIVEMVVMGTKIAEEAFGKVFENLTKQMAHAKVSTTEMLAQAGKFLTKVEPPSFMAPKGDETASYKYDAEKNADIGFKMTLS